MALAESAQRAKARIRYVFDGLNLPSHSVRKGKVIAKEGEVGVKGITEVPSIILTNRNLLVAQFRSGVLIDVVPPGSILWANTRSTGVNPTRVVALNSGTIEVVPIDQIIQHPEGEQLLSDANAAMLERNIAHVVTRHSPPSERVQHALREFADKDGLVVVTQPLIIKRSGVGISTLRRELRALEDKGKIERRGATKGQSVYML